ncbi:calcium-binding protein [Nocardioides immobilis]|uniref:Calcium-binding protein n=1 Tax=Nocardioides immobilis TaxID=2049295 RepID=A0A417XWA1_9ACTN|nr:calcium-binding protein [Nocardioides immobilis]RHW24585.1 calcium-binding protein [Nocardioides immobilis]
MSLSLDSAENDGGPSEHDFLGSDLEILAGGASNDTITGNQLAQTLNGNGGDDVLDGGLGSDIMFGGAGVDTVDYRRRVAPVTVSVDGVSSDGEAGENDWVPPENEIVIGGSGDDTLSGPDGSNIFDGYFGKDTLLGGAGDDVLDGGPGPDTLSGGEGIDLVTYEDRTQPVVVMIDALANDGEAGERDLVKADVEDMRGGSGADRLTGSGAANTLDGGAGGDTLAGGGGADLLLGGAGPDVLAGGGALDTVSYADRGFAVSATIDNTANDGSFGEGDNVKGDVEVLRGGTANDVLAGSGDAERLYGGPGDDVLAGNGGADLLVGEEGADELIGGAGADTASYAERPTNVVVTIDDVANDGRPSVTGERDNVRVDVEKVVGGVGNDQLSGSAAGNTLSGGPGDDQLDGLAGYDRIDGGDGFDSCVGEVRTNCP